MRFKMAQSEVDGLFMKANRKHEILLGFELKRIAVEKKMRERYFAFEKSIIVAHQDKIIARQKALGIYLPKTISDKKQNNFFVTNVSMEKKRRARLPPVGKANEVKIKEADMFSRSSDDSQRNGAVQRVSLTELTPSWSLTEVGHNDGDGKLIEHSGKANKSEGPNEEKDTNNANSTNENVEEKERQKSQGNSTTISGPNKILEKRRESSNNTRNASDKNNDEFAADDIERQNSETNKDIDNAEKGIKNVNRDLEILNESKYDKKNETRANPDQNQNGELTQTKQNTNKEQNARNDEGTGLKRERPPKHFLDKKEDGSKEERPKSVISGTMEGINRELMSLSMRAQSAGVQAAK